MEEDDKDKLNLLVEEVRERDRSKPRVLSLNQIDTLINEENISLLADKDKFLRDDLHSIKCDIDEKIDFIEKIDLILSIISYKKYEVQYTFRSKIDRVKIEREKLKSSKSIDVALDLAQMDEEIATYENECLIELEDLNTQKLEMQEKYEDAIDFLDAYLILLEEKLNLYELLLEDRRNRGGPSPTVEEINLIELIKHFLPEYRELQKTGWRTLTLEDKISTKLDEIGLRVSKSGLFLTKSGHCLTYEEVQRNKLLLEAIPSSLDVFFPKKKPEEKATEKLAQTTIKKASLATSESTSESFTSSQLSQDEVNYLKEHLGRPLTLALAEITAMQPKDPIHYLGHWLFKYRYNQEVEVTEQRELDDLIDERQRLAREAWHNFLQEEARNVILDLIMRTEQEVARRELKRIEEDLMRMGAEEEGDEESGRQDTFENYDNER